MKFLVSSDPRPNIKGMPLAELEQLFVDIGQPAYRSRQVYRWLYRNGAESTNDMTSLPLALRTQLSESVRITTLAISSVRESADGTLKFLFRLEDGREIESVLIPSETVGADGDAKRQTLCVSTQVGCPLDCKFCATATLKLQRNLTPGEIVDQLIQVEKHCGKKITNLVFMGMGEPMLNYDNVMAAVEIMTHKETEMLAPKRITLSTSGLVKQIRRMADENRRIKLAISLHAVTNGLRSRIMPINERFNLQTLGDAIEYYYRKTGIPVTYEYILFDGLNDSFNDATRLAKITRRVASKVNVIPFHPIDFTHPSGISAELRPAGSETFERFIGYLRELGVTVMIRSSSGKDIQAACGQLALANSSGAAVS